MNRSSDNVLTLKKDQIITDYTVSFLLSSYTVLFFLVVSQFKPQSVIRLADYYQTSFLTLFDSLWTVMQVSTFLGLLIIYLRKFKAHLFNIFFFVSMFYISIISYINGSPLIRIASIIIPPISILMLIELAYRYNVFDKLMLTLYTYFGSLIILNYITMLIYPNSFYTDYRGMDVTWIFGNYQQNLNWFVVFIAISYYVRSNCNDKLKYANLFTYTVIILTTIKVWSATTMVALGIAFGLIFFESYIKKLEIINIFYAYLAGIMTTVLIVVYEVQEYFTFFIETILQKSVNFSGRMRLWNNALKYILERPFFGQGIEQSSLTFDKIGKTTAHNHYLNLTYNGGLFYLFLTIVLVFLVSIKMRNYKDLKPVIYMNSAIISYFVYFLAEAKINLNIFILLITIVYYFSMIMEEKRNEQITKCRI